MSNPDNSEDVIIVTTRRVACDGGGGALGHPKTYLDMGQDNQVRCERIARIDRCSLLARAWLYNL